MVQRLKRVDNWRSRLSNELDRQKGLPFEWGRRDCALGLVNGTVIALTGTDVGLPWRGAYTSERGAVRALREAGFQTLGEGLADTFEEIHPDMADQGDIALIETEGLLKEAMAIFDSSSLIAMTDGGHCRIPRERAVRAFKVG